ncbi:hypothetical protein EDD80_102352 [Anseongella ginsenosidimutans]|uniref:Uncharacterized protein n=1 Tax=Anseongella ginsenosidimutans TaxID=496056 RepID=A0A4R3KVH3_9SPHI|nr:hypothetical protein [Anseongella ginsenosidimutans]QEC51788.1 hypothetical protein FRZ59_05170 [Anseongella ginsenosidimutans]TCS89158.1 hypothetical protein EDD80_102352 [Anseongella ginsenosidimutans]
MKKISNVNELRAEILRLKQKKKQQEISLKEHIDEVTNKFRPVMGLLDLFGIVESGQKGGGGSKKSLGKIALKKGLEYGLPYLMNRIFFHNPVKAGISSVLGIALGESAKNYLNNDPSRIIDPVVSFIRNILDGTKEVTKARKEKRSFENRYDNLDREIYS